MNNDLINKLKYISNNPLINGEYDEENYLFDNEAKILLDYITNLQEENERLKQPQIFIDTMDMEERYGEELYKEYLKKQLKDCKQRIKKAIEYIENNDDEWFSVVELIGILQGEDK